MCLILLYFSAISWQMLQYLSHISSKGHSHSSASENETPLFSPFNVWLESSLIAKPLGRPAARSWVRQMWRWGVAPLQGGKEFIGKLQRMIQKQHTAATTAAVSSFCSSQHVEWGGSPLSVREGGGVGLGRRMGGRGCMGGDGTRGKWHGTSMCNYAKQLFHMLSEGLCKRARAHPHSTDCVYDDPPLKITQLSSWSACKTPVQTWTLVFTILVTMMLLYQWHLMDSSDEKNKGC